MNGFDKGAATATNDIVLEFFEKEKEREYGAVIITPNIIDIIVEREEINEYGLYPSKIGIKGALSPNVTNYNDGFCVGFNMDLHHN